MYMTTGNGPVPPDGKNTSILCLGCGPYGTFSCVAAGMVYNFFVEGFTYVYSFAGWRPNTDATARRNPSESKLFGTRYVPSVYSFQPLT